MDDGQAPADFDPTRLLDGWSPAPAPAAPELDLSGLLQGLRPGAPAPDAERLQRLRARGYEMHDVEDIVLPELPPPPAPAAPPRLDLPALRPTRDPRLLDQWQPGAWIASCRRIAGASAELQPGQSGKEGPLLEHHAPQWLLALWPPQGLDRPLLSRWPQRVGLCALEDEAVGAALLAWVPGGAPLWHAELPLDWGLLAEIALHHEPALRPAQLQALRALIEAERLAQFERLNMAYAQAADGGIRLRPDAAP